MATVGAGKYDDECTYVRHSAHAEMAIVIVYGGAKGHGFSIQTVDPAMIQTLPSQLRFMADQIDEDLKRGGVRGIEPA